MAGGSEDKWNGNSWSCRENRTQTGGIAISTGVMGPVWNTTCKANSSVLENKMLIFSSRKKLLECFEVFWCEEKKQLRIIIIIEGIQAKSEGEEANTLIDQGTITWCHFSWVTRQSTLSTRNIDTAIRGFFSGSFLYCSSPSIFQAEVEGWAAPHRGIFTATPDREVGARTCCLWYPPAGSWDGGQGEDTWWCPAQPVKDLCSEGSNS